MSTRYKFIDNNAMYFTTSTAVDWTDVFTREIYKTILPDSIRLESKEMYNQRLNYLHWNPVTAGFVEQPWHWLYSSACDYFTDNKGMLNILILDCF